MKNDNSGEEMKAKPVGDIVAEDYRTADIFKRYGLDFCCGGKRPLAEACNKKGVNLKDVLREIRMLGTPGREQPNYNQWSISFIIDYIINNHHRYVRSKLPEIKGYAERVSRVHGGNHPEVTEIRELFLELADDMTDHMRKEEEIVFPYIRDRQEGKPLDEETELGTAEEAITLMEEEHDHAGGIMAEIESLSNGFTPPEGACATYRVLYASLAEFQEDLHMHVHLENNVLFPQAMNLERVA